MEVYIFDMDGTFLDSMDHWKNFFVEFLNKNNIEVDNKLLNKVNAMTVSESIFFITNELNIKINKEETRNELDQYMAYAYGNLVNIDPDIIDYFNFLKSNNKKLVLATATHRSLVDVVIERFQLENTFDLQVVSDEVDLHKDSQQYFLNIAKYFNVNPEKCIVFEDSLYSILSARQAGMEVVSITCQANKNHLEEIKEKSTLTGSTFGDIKAELKKVL